MIITFWIFIVLASLCLIGVITGFIMRKIIFALCMNIGLATCSTIASTICLFIQ